MSRIHSRLVMVVVALGVVLSSCDSTSSACLEGDDNEESAAQLTLAETYDQVRAGAG